jgi:type III pantothenate kinase
MIAGWHDPTMQFVSSILALRRRPFFLWTDTPDMRAGRGKLKAAARLAWLRWLFSKATAVVGTGCTALSALKDMGCPAGKLVNLPYFVDLDAFAPGPRRSDDTTTVYGSSGRLSEQKGYDLALEALARVYEGRPDAFVYRIAGIGPEADRLQQQAKNLGIAHRVELVGWLEPDNLPEFFSSLDVFLHPARYEPYGVAVLEAMASGKPVVGSDAAGVVVDRIRNGVNGFVHRSGSVADLVARIREIPCGRDGMERIGKAARVTVEEWPVSRGVDVIRSIIGRTFA